MRNYNDTIGNRTRYLPTCSAVPQPTAPPRTPVNCMVARIYGLEIVLIYLVNKILICDYLGMQVFNLNFSLMSLAV